MSVGLGIRRRDLDILQGCKLMYSISTRLPGSTDCSRYTCRNLSSSALSKHAPAGDCQPDSSSTHIYSFSNVGVRFCSPDSSAAETSPVCNAALFHTPVYRNPSCTE